MYCTLSSEYLPRPSALGNIPTLGAISIDIPHGRVEYVIHVVIPWVQGTYQNKTPVRVFGSDIPRTNHGLV